MRGWRRWLGRERTSRMLRPAPFMALFAPLGAAFLVFYVVFGRATLSFYATSIPANPMGLPRTTVEALAPSSAPYAPGDGSLVLDVRSDELWFAGERVGPVAGDGHGAMVLPATTRAALRVRLMDAAAAKEKEGAELGRDTRLTLTVVPRADTPFGVLSEIVALAQQVGVQDVRFAVRRVSSR